MRRVASLFLPTWPTGRLRRPGHAALPVWQPSVTRAHDGRRTVIAAADAAVQAWDLRSAMSLVPAQSYLRRATTP